MENKFNNQKLLDLINKIKHDLIKDQSVIDLFKEYNQPIDMFLNIPIFFRDLDVSAQTRHGFIFLNYILLKNDPSTGRINLNIIKPYIIHELTHVLQQITSKNPLPSSDNDNYLDDDNEIEAFQNQVKYIADDIGEDKAEKYVEQVLDHHDVNDDSEIEKRKKILMKYVGK